MPRISQTRLRAILWAILSSYNNTVDGDIDELLTAFDGAEIDQVDAQNALNMAIYGRAYEYIYAKEGMAELDSTSIDPENTFMVYDDSIERKPLFAVYYYEVKDDTKDTTKYQAEVLPKICTITWC